MAPEQARGQANLAPSADVFALGCLLYECLTGRPPFVGEHLEAILVQILFEPQPPVSALRPEVPEPLERLVTQMLAKEPSERPQNAMELLAAMHALEGPKSALLDRLPRFGAATEALSTREQQLVSVLIARSDGEPSIETTLNPSQAAEARQRLLKACEVLNRLAVRTELLSDDTLVAALSPERGEAATDQAQRAARCALLLHEHSRQLLPPVGLTAKFRASDPRAIP
jgi:serine/threonine protein kinase